MKIKLNKKLDKEVYLAFYNTVVGGADFGKKIRDDHPDIAKKNYNVYIDNFYLTHNDELLKVKQSTELCFSEIKSALFSELRKYFGHDYSQTNYICYLSIFDCNPRYIENKTFQVYYKRPYHLRKEVIAHELTHFAFYDFCREIGIEDSRALWELSEIFNVIFLNLPIIQKVIGAEELLFYPDLKDKLEAIKRIWTEQSNAKKFIAASLHYLQN